MTGTILSVRKGDIIVERLAGGKKSKTVVTHIVFNACSKRGVHINRNACYDNTAMVEIEHAEVSVDELEAAEAELDQMLDGEYQIPESFEGYDTLVDSIVKV